MILTEKTEQPEVRDTDLPVEIHGKTVILVDDVLYTGRTVRAAMDALIDRGRPRDDSAGGPGGPGHRELPIRADYVGKNVPTSRNEIVRVQYRSMIKQEHVIIIK